MAKVIIPNDKAHRLITPGPVLLLSAARKGKLSVTPISWACPVSVRPPMVAVAIFEPNFILELIRASGQFVINIPSQDLLRQVQILGSVSGRDVDKMALTGLHEGEPKEVETSYVDECLAHIECALVDILTPGDHAICIGEIVHAKAESEAFDDIWRLPEGPEAKELKPIHHLGGKYYAVLESRLEAPDPKSEESR